VSPGRRAHERLAVKKRIAGEQCEMVGAGLWRPLGQSYRAAAALVVMWGLSACAVGPDSGRPAVPAAPEWPTPAERVGSQADLG
jgi:hypothetical protein